MSAQPFPSGSGAAQYFCYQCNRTVTISPSPDPVCPLCNSGFIEEYQNPNPNPDPIPALDLSSLFGANPFPNPTQSTNIDEFNPFSFIQGPDQVRSPNPDEFNPFSFLQNYLNTLRAGGAHVQLVIDDNSEGGARGGGGFSLPSNLGDYFIGPGLEQLIQQLAENDPNRYGTPPASKSAIGALPDVKINKALLDSDYSQCAVCMDEFKLDMVAKQMPCKHMYHSDCILPWLELHNSCPVCRFELPTDDPEYENRARENPAGTSSGSGDVVVQEDAMTPRTAERRFRVTLPWPFRGFGGEGSGNSGAGGGNSTGGQAREEDLD